jgi:multidrug resistance efflux pump
MGDAPVEPTPAPVRRLEPTERVPRLRSDLQVRPASSEDPSIVEVQDATRQRKFLLRDFEMSVARMLNGDRSAKEVVDAAGRLGLPVTIDSLSHFLRKLESYGFLDPSPQPSDRAGPAQESNRDWSEDTRQQYQEAIRQVRSDHPLEARKSLVELLQKAPGTPEAVELLNRVDRAIDAGAAQPGRSFSEIYEDVERSWFNGGEAPAVMASLNELAPPISPRSAKPALIAGAIVLALVALIVLAVPWPYSTTAAVVLRATRSVPVTVPRAGTLAAVRVAEGQRVVKGAILATYDGADAKKRREAAEARVSAAEARLRRASEKPRVARKKADLDRVQGQVKRLQADLDRAMAKAKNKKTPAVNAAARKVAAGKAALAKAQKAYDASLLVLNVDALQREMAAASRERDAARAEEGGSITAPDDGDIVQISVRPGPVALGAPFARLEDPRTLVAVIALAPRDLHAAKPGQPVTVTLGGKFRPSTVQRVTENGVEVAVDNTSMALNSAAKGEATLDLGGRSLLSRL